MNSHNMDYSNRIEEILIEISECREDARNSENQIFQVMGIAIAVLGAIYVYGITSSDISEVGRISLYLINVIIFCTVFFYITPIGIVKVLRYHYIQDLEYQLTILNPKKSNEKEFVHWMSFSSPIITRNPKHLNSKYSKIHYFYYALAIILIIVFCAAITISQYQNLGDEYIIYARIGIIFLVIFMLLSFIGFIFFSLKAKRMFEFAMNVSIKKRHKRISDEVDNSKDELDKIERKDNNLKKKRGGRFKEILKVISYLYPFLSLHSRHKTA